jgi:DNA-binding NarL/FixJ family response regulator
MSFVVYEEDQFVTADILEMLAQSFPEEPVHVVADIGEFSDLLIQATKPMVAIVGSRLPDVDTADQIGAKRHAVVVISDSKVLPEKVDGIYKTVGRPFSSHMLLEAIRTVISCQLSPRS